MQRCSKKCVETGLDWLLAIFLRRYIRQGSLTVTTAAGRTYTFGDGSGPPVAVRFTTAKAAARGPVRSASSSSAKPIWTARSSSSRARSPTCWRSCCGQDHDRIAALGVPLQFAALPVPAAAAVQSALARRGATSRIITISTAGSISSSSTPTGNIAAPISRRPDQSLDDAQLAKKRHLAAKLLLEPRREASLDIGCGWGGLALYLAEIAGAQVTGITLSQEQYRARAAARRRKRADRADAIFRLRIIATSKGRSTASSRSACSSMSASASTTRSSASAQSCSTTTASCCCTRSAAARPPSITNPWIAKYIFPGGYIPALSEVLPAIERARLLVTDIEILRLHYAETLKAWRERFLAHREEVERLYDAALRADVGVLSGRLGNGVPRAAT